ncbi:hypothetical protein [Parachitinimonas caeni]|uniref:Uncharacterized protein n=1 Tax=Parachitinimonas caeni TaxID=3031301 RepID=A0ABT7DWZ7_9NEIS|nr:hypothetical protein [Parachitinimonas caeni]MDK2124590.1 hypothetical protein [Parachitinimonas caeni]
MPQRQLDRILQRRWMEKASTTAREGGCALLRLSLLWQARKPLFAARLRYMGS